MCCNVFNVWPKTTLILPVWRGDAKRLEPVILAGAQLTSEWMNKGSEEKHRLRKWEKNTTHTESKAEMGKRSSFNLDLNLDLEWTKQFNTWKWSGLRRNKIIKNLPKHTQSLEWGRESRHSKSKYPMVEGKIIQLYSDCSLSILSWFLPQMWLGRVSWDPKKYSWHGY